MGKVPGQRNGATPDGHADGTDPPRSMAEPAPAPTATVLLVDLGADARHDLVRVDALGGATVVRTRLADLDAALLSEVRPATVIGPLIGRECDAMALIAQLQSLGFDGRVVILARPLPNRAMVQRELRAAAGSLAVDLIERE